MLKAGNHIWFNQQSKEKQAEMNKKFQEYKKNYKKCELVLTDEIPEPEFEINLSEIKITDKVRVKPINRAKVKEETRKAYQEYLRGLEEV